MNTRKIKSSGFETAVTEKVMYQFDGLNEAVIGLATQSTGEPLMVYDYTKLVDIFMKDGMSREEAEEYIDYNVIGLNLGERTPLIMTPCNYEGALDLIGGSYVGAVQ